MRIRSVEEIQKEIDEYEEEYRDLHKIARLHCGRGFPSYGSPEYIKPMNDVVAHIKNLKLELNRAKLRILGKRDGVKNE